MPLVDFDEVKSHIAPSIVKVLEDPGAFQAAELEAAKIIRDRTGLSIPESPNERASSADWVVLPAAWIIQYIASSQVVGKSDTLDRKVREQFKDATDILADHPLKAVAADGSAKFTAFGCIEGMYE